MIGTPNKKCAAPMMMVICTKPTSTNGAILPIMISTGLIGMASRLSIVPRSISRVTASAVNIIMVMVSTTPSRPGTILYWVMPSGL